MSFFPLPLSAATAFVFSIRFHHLPRPSGSSLSSTAAVNDEIASSRAEKRRKSL